MFFFLDFLFETGFFYVALIGLKVTMQPKLTTDSQKSAALSFLSAELTARCQRSSYLGFNIPLSLLYTIQLCDHQLIHFPSWRVGAFVILPLQTPSLWTFFVGLFITAKRVLVNIKQGESSSLQWHQQSPCPSCPLRRLQEKSGSRNGWAEHAKQCSLELPSFQGSVRPALVMAPSFCEMSGL